MHVSVGKISSSEEALAETLSSLLAAIRREKPAGSKGHYIRTLTLTTTMSPGIRMDPGAVGAAAAADN